MREYKFRAWHESDKEMVYFNNSKWGRDQYQSIHLSILMRGEHEDGTLMQYTGLNDCNDKEIYEGDVVKRKGVMGSRSVCVIEACEGGYYAREETPYMTRNYSLIEKTGKWQDMGASGEDEIIYEVCGNIYENDNLAILFITNSD